MWLREKLKKILSCHVVRIQNLRCVAIIILGVFFPSSFFSFFFYWQVLLFRLKAYSALK